MSLHIQISPEAIERLRQQRRNSTVFSCLVAFLFVVLVGLILGLFLLEPNIKEAPVIVTYQSRTEVDDAPQARKVQTNTERKPSAPSASISKVITSRSTSDVAIPVPELDVTAPSLDFGAGDEFGTGWEEGSGSGSGAGGGGGFGSSNAGSGGLMGFMYDLKQDCDKRALPYRPETFGSSMVKIQKKKFSDKVLSDYFRSPEPLYLSRLAIPWTDASQGPKLFKVDQYIQPRGWFAHYSGTIIAPKSGRFRFVGLGDDYVLVSINGKPKLHASYPGLQEEVAQGWEASETPQYAAPFTMPSQRRLLLQSGDWINLRAGQEVEIAITIGERPGGLVWFILLVEEKGVKYKKAANGRPILPLFTTVPFSVEEAIELTDQFNHERFGNFELEFDEDKVPVFRLKK